MFCQRCDREGITSNPASKILVYGCLDGHVEEENKYVCETCAWVMVTCIEQGEKVCCQVCGEWVDDYLCQDYIPKRLDPDAIAELVEKLSRETIKYLQAQGKLFAEYEKLKVMMEKITEQIND